MKRSVWKISDSSIAELLLLQRTFIKPKTLTSPLLSHLPNPSNHNRFLTDISTSQSRSSYSSDLAKLAHLFTNNRTQTRTRTRTSTRTTSLIREQTLCSKLLDLSNELITNCSDSDEIGKILDSKAASLVQKYSNGAAFVDLLVHLKDWPDLALQVFNWRRKGANDDIPMIAEEYAKGITIAGRLKNVDLAVELFSESASKGIKSVSIYNALMTSYMYNGQTDKSRELFQELKKEGICSPTIVTYNILISIFGRLMLVDHMEATFKEIQDLKLPPTITTYNYLIAGYVTAWMWDDMERMFKNMEEGPIKPDLGTYLLMLRGYANSGKLEKMEITYERVKDYVNEKDISLVRAMICAYCKSSDKDRVRKVEALMKLIPEEEYKPWLNVLLIRLYAQENMVDGMDNFIIMAFQHKTSITGVRVMRSVIAAYFRCNAVEKLINFVKNAESSGWRICRSLYHCKMVMLASHNRLDEMESVLFEMDKFHIDPSQKTFFIMYKAYTRWGQRSRKDRLLGTMYKHGFEFPAYEFLC